METEGKRPALGLGHFTFLDLPPLALIRLAGRTGFSAVGLRFHPVVYGGLHYLIAAGSAAMRETKACLANEGVSVYDIETVVMDSGFEPDVLKPVFESAAELSAQRLNVCGDDAEHARLAANFDRVCELASEVGMGVDIECMVWREINSLDRCLDLVVASGRANAGILIDALHLARCGGRPEDLRPVPPPLLRSAQLCDAPLAAPESMDGIIAEARGGRLPPGEGALPLAALVDALPAAAFYSVEVPMQGDDEPTARAKRIFEGAMNLLVRSRT